MKVEREMTLGPFRSGLMCGQCLETHHKASLLLRPLCGRKVVLRWNQIRYLVIHLLLTQQGFVPAYPRIFLA